MNPIHPASTPSRTRHLLLAPLIVVLLAFGMTACGMPQNQQDETTTVASDTLDSIADLLTDDDRFGTFVTALDSAGLMPTLRDEGPYTLFAPTDSAFNQLPEGTVEDLLQPENRDRLTAILTYHLAESVHTSDDLANTSSTATIEGSDLSIGTRNGTVTVDDATVVEPDLEAGNGVIHVINAVLRPPEGETSL